MAFLNTFRINRGGSSVRYQAVQDNIFDKDFRGEFGGNIEEFDERDITSVLLGAAYSVKNTRIRIGEI